MPLKRGKGKKVIQENTQRLIEEGYPPKQAYAIAHSVARRGKRRKK